MPNSQYGSPSASQMAKPFVAGHPKMEKLKEIVVEHFQKMMTGLCQFGSKNNVARVHVFVPQARASERV